MRKLGYVVCFSDVHQWLCREINSPFAKVELAFFLLVVIIYLDRIDSLTIAFQTKFLQTWKNTQHIKVILRSTVQGVGTPDFEGFISLIFCCTTVTEGTLTNPRCKLTNDADSQSKLPCKHGARQTGWAG